jgi:hypothetical protein
MRLHTSVSLLICFYCSVKTCVNLHTVVFMLIQAAAAHLISQLTGLGVIFDMQSEELTNAALSVLTDLAQVFNSVDCSTLKCTSSDHCISLYLL